MASKAMVSKKPKKEQYKTKNQITITIDKTLREAIDKIRASEGRSVSNCINKLIKTALAL